MVSLPPHHKLCKVTFLRWLSLPFPFPFLSLFPKGLPDGAHLLEVSGWGLLWPYYRVEVQGSRVTVSASYLQARGDVVEAIVPATPLLDVFPVSTLPVFVPREPFSLIGFVTKPMHLMVIGTVVMIYVMPRMREWMDVEALAEEYEKMKALEKAEQRQKVGGGGGGGPAPGPAQAQRKIKS